MYSFILFFIGLTGGFISGFLGIGGAVIIIPMMIAIPVFFGLSELSMQTISALSIIQVFFASLSGIVKHRENKSVHYYSLFLIGIPMALFSFAGSLFSKYFDDQIILLMFGLICLIALLLLFIKKDEIKNDHNIDEISVKPLAAVILGSITGILTGIVGVGGGFVLIPLMNTILKIPLKIAVGNSLGIVLLGALTGSIGKVISIRPDIYQVMPLVLGSIISANYGAKTSNLAPQKLIRWSLIILVSISTSQIWLKIFRIF